MPQIERLVIEALTEYISPAAAQNLYERALRRVGFNAGTEDPAAWLNFINGPILAELRAILPIQEPTGSLRRLLRLLEETARNTPEPNATPPHPPASAPISTPKQKIDLNDVTEREKLTSALAHEEGVSGVLLQGPGYQEARLPGVEELPPIITVIHKLLTKQKPYKMYYSVFGEGQVLIRPLGPALIAVIAKQHANLGRLMHLLNSYEAKGGQS